ncbi:jg2504 [Pararge aegeria aegeria]|uniref:Jg2504 protein n=1 Tax=Pararge aegeria aegeria TaxID=348720 RepID=A0A8S4QRE6_9NEOP|nr:jg2504 [Pararge aegeria aegeria]
MISKYEEKKLVKQAVFREKQDCLRTVTDFLNSLEDNARTAEVKQAIEKITDLDQKDMMKSQNQYLEELSSLTDVSVITLKRIKKDKYKRRDHITENNLESFIINLRDSSDSSDSDDSLHVEFLDPDFDYSV